MQSVLGTSRVGKMHTTSDSKILVQKIHTKIEETNSKNQDFKMMNFEKLVLSAALLSLPYSVAFAEAQANRAGWGVYGKSSKTALFSTSVEADGSIAVATDEDDKNAIVVSAPLKYLGPYPALALRFPNLATSNQRKEGKSGVSLDFVLDTAANTNTIQVPIAKELEAPRDTMARAMGESYNFGDTQLDGVMDDLFVTDLGVTALPGGNPNAAGLLSLEFMKIFGGGIEFKWMGKPALTFYSGKKAEATQDKTMVPIEPLSRTGNLPSVTLTVNGVELKALLATGSPITVMNEEAAKLTGVERMVTANKDRKTKEEAGDIVVLQDAKGKPVDLIKSRNPVDVKAGSVDFGEVPLYVGDIPGMFALTIENEANPNGGPAIVLGLDVLVQRPEMLLRVNDNEVWFS